MAEWCDVLLCVAPGGASTRHLVNAALLRALGPQGYLLNLGRGSIVDRRRWPPRCAASSPARGRL